MLKKIIYLKTEFKLFTSWIGKDGESGEGVENGNILNYPTKYNSILDNSLEFTLFHT